MSHLSLYVELQFFDFFSSDNLEQHVFFVIFKFSERAFLRLFNIRKLVFNVFKCLDILFHEQISFLRQFVWIYLFLSWQEIVRVVNKSRWSVNQVARNMMIFKFLEYLYLSFILSKIFEIRNDRLTIWVFEIEHVILVLVILLDPLRLQPILFAHIFSLFTILLSFELFLLHMLPLLSSLSLLPLMFLKSRSTLLLVLFFVLEGLSSWLKCALAEFIFTRALECLIINYFVIFVILIFLFLVLFLFFLFNHCILIIFNHNFHSRRVLSSTSISLHAHQGNAWRSLLVLIFTFLLLDVNVVILYQYQVFICNLLSLSLVTILFVCAVGCSR